MPIPMDPILNYSHNCTKPDNVTLDNLFYWLQFAYLVPVFFILLWIIVTIRVRHREWYQNNLFFWILTVDCCASIILILLDLSITRLFLYYPQLCADWSPVFINHPIISHIYFPLYNYVRAIKPVTQCAMILMRFLCVADPCGHEDRWKRKIPISILTILLVPFAVIWCTIISKKEVVFWLGGFFIIYHRTFQWVSLSMSHFISLTLSIGLILTLSIGIIQRLPGDFNPKPSRTLCLTSGFIAFGFALQAAFQSYYAFFREVSWFPSVFIHLQFVFYDVITIGTPVMMLIVAADFRARFFNQKSSCKTVDFNGGSRQREGERIAMTDLSRTRLDDIPFDAI